MEIRGNYRKRCCVYTPLEDIAYLIYFREKHKLKEHKTTKFCFFKYYGDFRINKYMKLAEIELRRQKLLKIKKKLNKKN